MEILRTERRLTASNGTVYLALPKAWLRANGLVQKSEVILIVDEKGVLSIRPSDEEIEFQARTRRQIQ